MKTGGPAFPVSYTVDADHQKLKEFCGMTLRDWFAGQALPSLIVAALELDHIKWDGTVKHAYIIADAMLAERDKQ